jgi:hypothetical protein
MSLFDGQTCKKGKRDKESGAYAREHREGLQRRKENSADHDWLFVVNLFGLGTAKTVHNSITPRGQQPGLLI